MLERDILEPNRYQYLDTKDSQLYDTHKDRQDTNSQTIIKLLEAKANMSRSMHTMATY